MRSGETRPASKPFLVSRKSALSARSESLRKNRTMRKRHFLKSLLLFDARVQQWMIGWLVCRAWTVSNSTISKVPILAARGEHSIRLVSAFSHQIVYQDSDVAFIAANYKWGSTLRRKARVGASDHLRKGGSLLSSSDRLVLRPTPWAAASS